MLDKVFVYGSLRCGGHYEYVLAPYVRSSEPAVFTGGRLYQVAGHYPGMVGGEGKVLGDLVALDPARLTEAMAALDELEDYHGPNHRANLYERVEVQVETADGECQPAWVYLWLGATEGYPEVSSGDWLDWLQGRP